MRAPHHRQIREIDLMTVATREQTVELRLALRRLTNDGRITDEAAALVENLADQLGDALDDWPAPDPNAAGGPGDPFEAWARADLEAQGVAPEKAAEVIANTYSDEG